jgi:hypothetical protein
VTSASSAIYSRVDSNATTVWAPRTSVAARVDEAAGLEAAFAVDVWTGASIDVVTAASYVIRNGREEIKPVHEVRKEVTAGGYYEFDEVTLSGGYRYSTENDYWSNGGVVNTAFDMANNNATLGLSLFGSSDVVGRSGDPGFTKSQRSVGGRASLTQVIDTDTVAQLSWETTRIKGYQASPYRFVGIGGDGTCAGTASYCVPEVVPEFRVRNAAVGRVRRAFGERVSIGLEYRLYFDDWSLVSHTLSPDLAVLMGEHGTFSASYRYYTQGETSFYRPRYVDSTELPAYVTRDRELSAFYSNRLGLGYTHEFPLGHDESMVLRAALRLGFTRYDYLSFVGLDSVRAFENTFLLSVGWL